MSAKTPAPRVVCFGEVLLDLIAEPRGVPLHEVSAFRPAAGGSVANVATGLGRLGIPTAFHGLVGPDPFGRMCTGMLRAEGVDTSHVTVTPEGQTGVVFVTLSGAGEPHFHLYPQNPANTLIGPEHVHADHFAGAPLMHFGGNTIVLPRGREATLEAIRLARVAAAFITFDLNIRLHQWPDHGECRRVYHAFVPRADWVKANLEELEFLTGTADPHDGAQRLLELGAPRVALTGGAQGAWQHGVGATGHVPTDPVTAVDATGAGDAFCAGVLAWLFAAHQRGEPPSRVASAGWAKALRLGNFMGARAVSAVGATTNLPGRAEAAAYLT